MMPKKSLVCAAALLLAAAPALAAHGKVGLWNITTSMTMANMPQIPPEALAHMKAMGMKMPGSGEPIHTQICMTAAQVNSDTLPKMRHETLGCSWSPLKISGGVLSADMVCNGDMKGTGHVHVSYSGAEHYSGDYSFKGAMHGHPADMQSSFSGDWVKADCGSVKSAP
jgi:hypothetical protein